MNPGRGVEAIFAALADPTRRTVLDELAHVGPMSATQLATRFPVSRQAVVKHLSALSGAGLVTSVRDGRDGCFILPLLQSWVGMFSW